ncbi:MAG: hypothetical protein PHZ00_02385 [Candidatus Peribacteraceae bacterium]|nr:hypothetical protein [Candidatus Peribacteraceae bacterium]
MFRLNVSHWHILRINFLMAGLLSAGGTLLGLTLHPAWFALPVFIGAMQIIFALSGYCPSSILLDRIGFPRS